MSTGIEDDPDVGAPGARFLSVSPPIFSFAGVAGADVSSGVVTGALDSAALVSRVVSKVSNQ